MYACVQFGYKLNIMHTMLWLGFKFYNNKCQEKVQVDIYIQLNFKKNLYVVKLCLDFQSSNSFS